MCFSERQLLIKTSVKESLYSLGNEHTVSKNKYFFIYSQFSLYLFLQQLLLLLLDDGAYIALRKGENLPQSISLFL